MNTPAGAVDEVHLDPQNPWLGLFSYSEETRAYFHGRDEEAGELARRVQRKLLTVLFGQSGLGKTSLLRAGLVPRLRNEGYCPIYVRIVYAPDSPPPAEQIKQAIFKATAAAGYWTRPGSALEGESLWEFMHHRGDLLRDTNGQMLVPLLIFDQFEEVFTLAQADDVGKLRAREFLQQLADLVENRPPAALEARIEQDDNAAEDFDFARADYRVLIALREDYLAHLEGVKTIMPSITQNRMRLARMTGAQALSAVLKPGGKLVTQEVAESIVRFVAGGSELGNAEIEPSLLSLVCRELNTVRQMQGRNEISADLLAGSRDTILSEFYERTLADQPPGVRRVIEDELLTESGYRESLAEERVIKALVAEGASPDSLATLVNRRLLRIEERLDMRRVELTHDVLCSVVSSSRDRRHEREARDESERQLAAQREREAAQHRALVRARMIASVCAVLMVIAGASAIFGWVNWQRARVADAAAQKARGDAEKLVGFLIEDFYTELAPTGRLETLGKLAHMTITYYDGLPAALMTGSTQVNRAMALAREGSAKDSSGDSVGADKDYHEAQAVFEKLRAGGDHSEAVTYGLALVLYNQGNTIIGGGRGTAKQLEQAIDLLRPLVRGPKPSRQVRQLYADILNVYSHVQKLEDGVASCEEARKILEGLGGLDLSDLNAASAYADTTDSQARHELSLGRVDDALKHEQLVYELTEKVLAQRPSDLRAQFDRFYATDLLSSLAQRRHDITAAADYAQRSATAGEDAVRFNPADLTPWGYWVKGLNRVADLQFDRGEISAAIATDRSILALTQDKRAPANLGTLLPYSGFDLAGRETLTGQTDAGQKSLALAQQYMQKSAEQFPPGSPGRQLFSLGARGAQNRVHYLAGQYETALNDSNALVQALDQIQIPPDHRTTVITRNGFLDGALSTLAISALQLDRGAPAEAAARRALALPADPTSDADPHDNQAWLNARLALAVALQGRREEVGKILAPALAYYREQYQAGDRATGFLGDFAFALYASAMGRDDSPLGRSQRQADLTEAAKLLDGLSAEARQLTTMRVLATRIDAARGPN
jgi:tetratricopeptide (TPR) repeat protein